MISKGDTENRKFSASRILKNRILDSHQKLEVFEVSQTPGTQGVRDVIGFENKQNFRDVVLYDLLKIYSKRGVVKLIKSNNNSTKTAIASTSDSEADKIIHTIINNDISKLKQGPVEKIKNKIFIKPLYLFLDKEVLLYAKLRGLKYREVDGKEDKISEFIEDLEKKHPEIKQSIIGSYLELIGWKNRAGEYFV